MFENGISIRGCEFKSKVDIYRCVIKDKLFLQANIFHTDCIWYICSIGKFEIQSTKFCSFLLRGFYTPTHAKEITLHLNKTEGDIEIINFNLQKISLWNTMSSDMTLHVMDIVANSISFHSFRNDGSFRLSNIFGDETDTSTVEIYSSYFGKTELYNIDFTRFKKLNIYQSNLVDCSFNNVRWKFDISSFFFFPNPNMVKRIEGIETAKGIDYFKSFIERWRSDVRFYNQHLRETYRQLKFALSKQGDSITEQKFHAKEMQAFNRSLHPINDFFKKLIIKFSSWFSDFGQSFSKPFRWLLSIHFILFLFAIEFANLKPLKIDIFHPRISPEGVYYYFKLINPLRRPDGTFTEYSILIDIMIRIWSSYMIYNIIRATRRYIK